MRRYSAPPLSRGFGIPEAMISLLLLAVALVGIQKAFFQNKGTTKLQSLGVLQISLESDLRAALEDPSMIRKLPSGAFQLLRSNPSVAGGKEVIADTTNNTIIYFDDEGEKCPSVIRKCPFGVQAGIDPTSPEPRLVYRLGQNRAYALEGAVFASVGVPGPLETNPTFRFSVLRARGILPSTDFVCLILEI